MNPRHIIISCSIVLAVCCTAWHGQRQAVASSEGGNPLARGEAGAASPDQLKQVIEQMFQAASQGDIKALAVRISALQLPDASAWFAATFGQERGEQLAREYEQLQASFQEELQALFRKLVEQGRSEVSALKVESPDDPNATGLQADALKAMKRPCPLFTVRVRKPADDAGMTIWSFVFVDGEFRLIGKMRAVSEPAGPRTEAAPAPAPAPGQAEAAPAVLRFRRLSVRDQFIGCDAFTMLIPAGWRAEGGVHWRANPFKPATAIMRITSPNGQQQFEIVPQMPFVDGARESAMQSARMAGDQAVAMMAARFAEGNLCFGSEVRRRVDDPRTFVRQFVLPRFRSDRGELRISQEQELPAVAEGILASDPAEPGTRKTVRAGRIRIEFTQGGQSYEEDIYCVLVLVDVPPIRQTYWGAEHLFAFRAPKGQLDGQIKVLQTMVDSLRIDLRWFNKYVQLVGSLIQGQIREIENIGEFSRRWAQMSDQISSDRQRSWEANQARYDEMNRRYSRYQRGVEEYRDAQGNRVELPSGYTHGWVSGNGEYVVTDNPNFNPNVEWNGSWTPLEKEP